MGIDLILKVATVGIVLAIVNAILQSNDRKDLIVLCNIAGIVVAIMLIIGEVSDLFDTIRTMFQF